VRVPAAAARQKSSAAQLHFSPIYRHGILFQFLFYFCCFFFLGVDFF
jgi:hypothetical protein